LQLDAKAFPQGSTHIVASYRAKVNDSKPVDAFGKVENLLRQPLVFFRREKCKEERKIAQRLLRKPERKAVERAAAPTLLFLP
jgi:hypothetical protein